MAISTTLTRCLKIDAPILLAPMAGVSGGTLASAVSDAGGLGFIGGGYCDRGEILHEIENVGRSAFGVGFITWALAKEPALLDEILEYRPNAIFLSFGDIAPFAGKIKQAGIPLIAQVQTVAQARDAVADGADIIVAQGTEAGGHGHSRSTLTLVPEVVDAVGDVPVLAAGGIVDGRGLAASLMLGAAGVVCGTAFYATHEALAHPNAKSAAIDADGDMTVRSSVFDAARGKRWPKPWNLRTLRNRFHDNWEQYADNLLSGEESHRRTYTYAASAGEIDTMAVIVGEGVGLIDHSSPAGDVVRNLIREAERLLATAPALSLTDGHLGPAQTSAN